MPWKLFPFDIQVPGRRTHLFERSPKSKVQCPRSKVQGERCRIVSITRFEDINAWQEARVLTRKIFEVTGKDPFSKKYRFREQLESASISIMANIAEGFDSQSDAEFARFLIYARRSASEVQSHLYAAIDQSLITKDEFSEIFNKSSEVKSLVSGFIRYLKKKKSQ